MFCALGHDMSVFIGIDQCFCASTHSGHNRGTFLCGLLAEHSSKLVN